MLFLNFYKFSLVPLEGMKSLFSPEQFGETQAHYSDEYECLASFFDQPAKCLQLYVSKITTTGDRPAQESEAYRCDVMRIEDGIILFTIENNRIKHTIVNKQDIENPHHPYTRIILNTRQHVLAIERNAAFGSDPQKIIGILEEGIDNLIGRYRMKIQFTELKKSRTDFWETINDLRVQFKDIVRQIRIDFLGKESDSESSTLIQLLTILAKKAECEGSILLSGSGEGEVNINEIRQDLEAIASICLAQPSYCLSVRFKNFGLYRYGAGVQAQFELDEKVLQDFEHGTTIMDFDTNATTFSLIQWLNKINTLLDGYEEQPVVYTGRTSLNRR